MPDRSELERFLDLLHGVTFNLNDCFDYAMADAESVYMDQEANQDALVKVFREYGFDGLMAYAAKIRGREPLRELRTPAYQQATDALDGWEYEAG